jgi:beta-lactam-binding protein with PASTA domain
MPDEPTRRPRPKDLEEQVDTLLGEQVKLRGELTAARGELRLAQARSEELARQLQASRDTREVEAGPAVTIGDLGGQLKASLAALESAPLPEGARTAYVARVAAFDLKAVVEVDDDGTPRLRFPRAGTSIPDAALTSISLTFDATPQPTVDLSELNAVPTVVGLTEERARARLAQAGLVLGGTEEREAPARPGTVISQDPETGGYVEPGTAVDVVVAVAPRRAVPDVVGMTADDAAEALGAAGFDAAITEVDDDGPEGTVLGQDPVAGTPADAGDEVALRVVARRPRVEVPAIRGLDLRKAVAVLEEAGLRPGRVEHLRGEDASGTVLRSEPAQGRQVPKGSAVDLVVAIRAIERTVVVPELVGLDRPEALRILREGRWGASVEAAPVPAEGGGSPRFDRVVAQDPPAGQPVLAGRKVVRLTVPASAKPPSAIHGVGRALGEQLVEAGYTTVGEIALAEPIEIAATTGLSEAQVRRWHAAALVENATEDLDRIEGVDRDTAITLARAGVTSAGRLAALDPAELAEMVKRSGSTRGTTTPRALARIVEAARRTVGDG